MVDGVPESVILGIQIASAAGCLAVGLISTADGAWMVAIAVGLLAMLTDSPIPFAYDRAKDRA